MNLVFKSVLSMSLSGALLILTLLFGGRLLKGKLGRQWQYYIWLVVVVRLFLPFGPEVSLMGQVYRAADRAGQQLAQESGLAGQSNEQSGIQGLAQCSEQGQGQNTEPGVWQNGSQFTAGEQGGSVTGIGESMPADSQKTTERDMNGNAGLERGAYFLKALTLAGNYLWSVWLAVALGMFVRKISMYQRYIRQVTAGAERVCDISLLDRLAVMTERAGIGRPVELCVNPLVSSPMLVGYVHPCIILPDADVAEKDFSYIVMHELTHYKRRDIWYKWLVQFTVCLHWFNPLVHVMSREIDKACEFACDEAVVRKMGYDHARDYGETLLEAMVQAGTGREPFAAVTMSADKELLRERLGAIMNCKRKTKVTGMITAGLTAGIVLGTILIGVYPTAAAEPERTEVRDLPEKTGIAKTDKAGTTVQENAGESVEKKGAEQKNRTDSDEAVWSDAEKYYEAGSLPQFYIEFNDMDEKEQEIWLDRFYADGATPFFSVGVLALDTDSPLIPSFAEKCYEDGSIAFFSILAKTMDEGTLEKWLERAMADQKWNFQSMLYHEMGSGEEQDEMEKALEEEQLAQYRTVGVTKDGKKYYYKGELVNIFLDIHMPNQSFYTLDMNPAGTVNIRIVRTQDDQITGVAYMTEAEVRELLGDLYEDGAEETDTGVTAADEWENEVFPREMVVNMPVCRIRAGAGEACPVIGLVGEGETVTVLGKNEDTGGRLWYLLDQKSLPEQPDPAVEACYIRADLLKEE